MSIAGYIYLSVVASISLAQGKYSFQITRFMWIKKIEVHCQDNQNRVYITLV